MNKIYRSVLGIFTGCSFIVLAVFGSEIHNNRGEVMPISLRFACMLSGVSVLVVTISNKK
jgi:hypothetical protein